jgi:uncharacterized protein YggT (Ycf19 family)
MADRYEEVREDRYDGGPQGVQRREQRYVQQGAPSYTGYTTTRAYDPRPERIVWFVVALIDALLVMRFLFRMMGASPSAEFVRFVYAITQPLIAPFQGIFNTTGQGAYIFEPESLVALIVYSLLGWAVVALLRILLSPRRPGVA